MSHLSFLRCRCVPRGPASTWAGLVRRHFLLHCPLLPKSSAHLLTQSRVHPSVVQEASVESPGTQDSRWLTVPILQHTDQSVSFLSVPGAITFFMDDTVMATQRISRQPATVPFSMGSEEGTSKSVTVAPTLLCFCCLFRAWLGSWCSFPSFMPGFLQVLGVV